MKKLPCPLTSVYLVFLLLSHAATAHAASISGNVSNFATGNLLQGARVDIPALGVSALVDQTGRYVVSVQLGRDDRGFQNR